MNRHYSSNKFFSWLRRAVFKVDKPVALGWGEWDKWDKKLKKERPIAGFFTESLPDALEWIPKHTIDHVDDFRYKISNRVNGTHRLDSNLKKGEWHEFETRLLHSMFDSFIDYIEIEEANSHIGWNEEADKKYHRPWWNRYRILRWGKRRRLPEAGIDHLKWEMKLDEPDPTDPHHVPNNGQAAMAREKMMLYTWWKDVRPSRGDSWDASGFRAFWTEMDKKYGTDDDDWLGLSGKKKMTAAEKRRYDKLQDAKEALETQWDEEDTQMMKKLIDLRHSLWT